MLKQNTYLINIVKAPFKLSNLKHPIYYKFWPETITNYGSFIAHHDNLNYKLLQDYYKLQQKIITNCGSFITNCNSGLLQVTAALLQITAKIHYKLRQIVITNYGSSYFSKNSKLLQIIRQVLLHITAVFSIITNYGNFYYKLRQVLQITTLLQITS